MKKLLLLLMLFSSVNLFSQENYLILDTIGMDQYEKQIFEEKVNSPESNEEISCLTLFAGSRHEFNSKLKSINESKSNVDINETIRIPVVYHIMHITKFGLGGVPFESGLISKQQVWSALDDHIKGFQAYVGTRQETGYDTNIEFYLANLDEEGNLFDGVIYYDMDTVPWVTTEEREQFFNFGMFGIGLDDFLIKNNISLDPDRYLNVYITPEISGNDGGNGIQGYAFFPGGTQALWGQTNLSNIVGLPSVNYYDADFDGIMDEGVGPLLKPSAQENDTHPHETGHNFRLYHTFQGQSCAIEGNCDTQGDGICDTEPTPRNTQCNYNGCPTPTPVSNKNYMSYSECRFEFTEDQNHEMRSSFTEDLPLLVSSIDSGLCYIPRQTQVEMIIPQSNDITGCPDSPFLSFTVRNLGPEVDSTGIPVMLTNLVIAYGNDLSNVDTFEFNLNLGPFQYDDLVLPSVDNQSSNRKIKLLSVNGFPVEDSSTLSTNLPVGPNELIVVCQPNCSSIQDNYWKVTNLNTGTIAFQSEYYPVNYSGPPIETRICLPGGNYQFSLIDESENGWNGTFCNPDFFDEPFMEVYYNGSLCQSIQGDEFNSSEWSFTNCNTSTQGLIENEEEPVLEYEYYTQQMERVEFEDIVTNQFFIIYTYEKSESSRELIDRDWIIKQ